MTKLFCIIFCVAYSSFTIAEDSAISKRFLQNGVKGTIVISSLNSDQTFIHNEDRANQRFSTVSTFKIPNTLIAIEEKAISSKDDLLKWNGRLYSLTDWNHDQTLESAFKVSCVWCFQELARRVGKEKYRSYLHKWNYGLLQEPFEETSFWLDGSLQISAIEQIEFLKKVYMHSLNLSESSYETLRQIMVVETASDFTLRAKTGWAVSVTPQIGWYVGYVETKKDVWFFAMNIDIRDEKELPLRQKLTREILRDKEII